jgi:hypothetical protein
MQGHAQAPLLEGGKPPRPKEGKVWYGCFLCTQKTCLVSTFVFSLFLIVIGFFLFPRVPTVSVTSLALAEDGPESFIITNSSLNILINATTAIRSSNYFRIGLRNVTLEAYFPPVGEERVLLGRSSSTGAEGAVAIPARGQASVSFSGEMILDGFNFPAVFTEALVRCLGTERSLPVGFDVTAKLSVLGFKVSIPFSVVKKFPCPRPSTTPMIPYN